MQIEKRGDMQWRVRVRKRGFPDESATFLYREDAEKWGRAKERELETTGFIDRRKAEKTTLREVLERYRDEVAPGFKSADQIAIKVGVLLKDKVLPSLKMTALSSEILAEWRDRRLKQVSGGTVNREIDILSTAIRHARQEWGIIIENPVRDLARPPKARERNRRLAAEEEQYLVQALTPDGRNFNGGHARSLWFKPAVLLALETAMRRGELLAMTWEHVHLPRHFVHLPETKNGDARDVPLSRKAVQILKTLPGGVQDEGRVFPITPNALRIGMTRAVKNARAQYLADCKVLRRKPTPGFLEDFRFHDTRHEAATRLSEKLSNVLELSAVTGHRDLRMLKRYYHPKAEDLAKKLG